MSELESPRPTFYEKLQGQWDQLNFLCVGLDSDYGKIPEAYKLNSGGLSPSSAEETIFTFNRDIIEVTHDLVGMWKPNLAFYEKRGEEGRRALNRTIRYIRENHPDVVIILDAKRGDIANTNEGYVLSDFEEYDADAVTIHSYLGPEAMKPFLDRKDKGTIVLVKTSNPGSGRYQNLRVWGKNRLVYEDIAHDVRDRWNVNQNCGVVVGATYPRELAKVRKIVGRMPILIPGIGTQGGDLAQSIAAGRDDRDQGMIINNSSAVIFPKLKEGQHFKDAVRSAALQTRNGIHSALERPVIVQVGVDLQKHPEGLTETQEALLLDIFDKKMFRIDLEKGFRLKFHKEHPEFPEAPLSPLYINLRGLRAHPEAKLRTVEVLAEMLESSGVQYDLLADIPTAATPLISSLSDMLGTPMITPRGDKKGYGSGDNIDGFDAELHAGKTAILFDDLATDGGSKITPAKALRSVGMNVDHVFILVDREQGAEEQLAKEGLTLHSAFKLKAMVDFYVRSGRITTEEYDVFQSKMATLTAFIDNVNKHPEGFTEEEETHLLSVFSALRYPICMVLDPNPESDRPATITNLRELCDDFLSDLKADAIVSKTSSRSNAQEMKRVLDFYKRSNKIEDMDHYRLVQAAGELD